MVDKTYINLAVVFAHYLCSFIQPVEKVISLLLLLIPYIGTFTLSADNLCKQSVPRPCLTNCLKKVAMTTKSGLAIYFDQKKLWSAEQICRIYCFYHGSKHYEPWSDCSFKEQSELGWYCLQFSLPKYISRSWCRWQNIFIFHKRR